MTTLTQIIEKDWSLSIDAQGVVVEGISDIHQCIYIIITTPKGSDPLRPDFGCDIFRWLDKPVNLAYPNMIKETVEAIKVWEPRVVVKTVMPKIDASLLYLKIEWETLSSSQIQSTQVTYGRDN